MGRLLDAAASLAGIASRNGFEGQAPMRFEAAISGSGEESLPGSYGGEELDWRPAIAALVVRRSSKVDPGDIARRFHNTLVDWIAAVAKETGLERVVLSWRLLPELLSRGE